MVERRKGLDWGVPSRGGSLWGTLRDTRLQDHGYCSVAYRAYVFEFCISYEFEHLIPLHWDLMQSSLDNLVASSKLEESRRSASSIAMEVDHV